NAWGEAPNAEENLARSRIPPYPIKAARSARAVRRGRRKSMINANDRRAPGTSRIPFDAMVEVGGALGPSFEAQAVNLSGEGMSLRTAYLPEVGQPVMCRFDAGPGMSVVAAGEVLWKDEMDNGGMFGIRFTNLDAESSLALRRILGLAEDGQSAPREQGRK